MHRHAGIRTIAPPLCTYESVKRESIDAPSVHHVANPGSTKEDMLLTGLRCRNQQNRNKWSIKPSVRQSQARLEGLPRGHKPIGNGAKVALARHVFSEEPH